jgi:signal transduction histidine kinase
MTHRKEAEDKLRTMASQLALTEERQRRALAQDLHDHVGQLLSTGKLKLQSLRRKTKEQENLPRIEEIISLLEESIQDVKSMTFQLSPSILFDLGFEVALEWLLEQFEKKHGLRCSLKDDGCGKHISDDLKAILFRSVRELMMNVVKHAKARNVSVRTWGELGCVLIRVSDDGVGFETATLNAADGSKGFGIFSIREQMAHLGGWLTVESQPGAGTAVTLRVPSSTPAEEEGS